MVGDRIRASPTVRPTDQRVAMHGEVSKTRWTRIIYAVFRPLWPRVRVIAPRAMITTEELGRAMIRVARRGAPKRVLENRDLLALGAMIEPSEFEIV